MARGVEATVEVDGADDRFKHGGDDRRRQRGAAGHAFAESEKQAEVEFACDFRADFPADDGRFDFRQFAFEKFLVA